MQNIIKDKKYENNSERIFYFDNLKFFLITLVVIGHFMQDIMGLSLNAKRIWIFIYSFHMPLFMFVSGFFSKNGIKNKRFDKCIIYLLLHFILKFMLFILDYFILKKDVEFNMFSEYNVSWYLLVLAIYYFVTILFYNAKIKLKYLFIISIFLSLLVGLDKNNNYVLCSQRAFVFYPFFLLGLIVSKKSISKCLENNKIKLLSFFILIILFIICIFFIDKVYIFKRLFLGIEAYGIPSYNYGLLLRILSYFISFTLGFCVLNIVPRRKLPISNLGSRTLTVYIIHMIVVELIVINFGPLKTFPSILLGIIVSIILSQKLFSIPINWILKLNLIRDSKKF